MEPTITAQEIATQAQMDRAADYFESALAVNLDEVTSDTVSVMIKEYADDPQHPGRRIPAWRRVELDRFVPMKIFNKMMASRLKAQKQIKLREQALERDGDVNEDDPNVLWMMQNVLNVWNLTEPDMTLERLEEGLNFAKIQKLFALFFGEMMSLNRSKAVPAVNTTSAPAPSVETA